MSGTAWLKRTADDNNNTGRYPSMAIDSLGRLHISYYSKTEQVLRYAVDPPMAPPGTGKQLMAR